MNGVMMAAGKGKKISWLSYCLENIATIKNHVYFPVLMHRLANFACLLILGELVNIVSATKFFGDTFVPHWKQILFSQQQFFIVWNSRKHLSEQFFPNYIACLACPLACLLALKRALLLAQSM